jgi:hypothetical protein
MEQTNYGGTYQHGVVFSLKRGSNGACIESVLHTLSTHRPRMVWHHTPAMKPFSEALLCSRWGRFASSSPVLIVDVRAHLMYGTNYFS